MNEHIDPVLGTGIILNFANLLLRHFGAYDALKLPDGARCFLSGAVAAVLLLGLIRMGLGPERLEAIKQSFLHFFGG